jgi:hypothetical protein
VNRIISVSSGAERVQNRRHKTVNREIVIGPNAIKFVAIAICALLSLVYLTQSTAGANRSVRIRNLESKQADLQLEKERLEVEQTRLKSLKEIDNGVEKNVLEPVSSVEHVKESYAVAGIR